MSVRKSADALMATGFLDDIILERFLIKILPKNRQYSLKKIKKLTGYNFSSIRKYVNSELFTIHKANIEITDNNKLLSEKSKIYCEKLIKNLVFPSKYEHDEYIYYTGKLFDNSYYTSEEKNFINLMSEKLFSIINDNIDIRLISYRYLLKYNLVNSNWFSCAARDIYNAIIQKKLHAGDNIMPFITRYITDKKEIYKKLESSSEFDYFFNRNAVLQCDLDTNINLLIKNFLNLIIYNFEDKVAQLMLLLKLNSKYSFLIKDKIFNDFE